MKSRQELLARVDNLETHAINMANKQCGGPDCSCDYSVRRIIEELVVSVRKSINQLEIKNDE